MLDSLFSSCDPEKESIKERNAKQFKGWQKNVHRRHERAGEQANSISQALTQATLRSVGITAGCGGQGGGTCLEKNAVKCSAGFAFGGVGVGSGPGDSIISALGPRFLTTVFLNERSLTLVDF